MQYRCLGLVGMLWCVLFYFAASSTPEKHPHISEEERIYLLHNNNKDNQKDSSLAYPWKDIVKSRKFHAAWITHMCTGWGFYLLAVCLPMFCKEVLNLTNVKVSVS